MLRPWPHCGVLGRGEQRSEVSMWQNLALLGNSGRKRRCPPRDGGCERLGTSLKGVLSLCYEPDLC